LRNSDKQKKKGGTGSSKLREMEKKKKKGGVLSEGGSGTKQYGLRRWSMGGETKKKGGGKKHWLKKKQNKPGKKPGMGKQPRALSPHEKKNRKKVRVVRAQ